MDEARLIEKLLLIEALFAGAATEGEKVAAERARRRIMERLRCREREDPPVEYRFSMGDLWSRKVFVALLRRYGIRPYRYKGQRYTTVMARVPKRFVDETLWPEFREFSETLRTYLSEVTERVVSQVIHQDISEADVVDEPLKIALAVDDGGSASIGSSASPGLLPQEGCATPEEDGDRPAGDRSKRTRKRKKRKRR